MAFAKDFLAKKESGNSATVLPTLSAHLGSDLREPSLNVATKSGVEGQRSNSGPRLAMDPADRVLPSLSAPRRQGRYTPIIIVIVGAVLVGGGFLLWTKQGNRDVAQTPSVISSTTTSPAPTVPAPTVPAPTDGKPAAQEAATLPASSLPAPSVAAPSVPAPSIPTSGPAVEPSKTTTTVKEDTKTTAVPAQAPTKAPSKPATNVVTKPKPATTQKTSQPKPATKTVVKPMPATTPQEDSSFSNLLNSITNEAPQQPQAPTSQLSVGQPPIEEPLLVQPQAAQPNSTTPLPATTAPSTPGSQLFTP